MSRDRSSSVDTVKAIAHGRKLGHKNAASKVVTLWVHDDSFAKEDVLINHSIFDGLDLGPESLVKLAGLRGPSEVRDFQGSQAGTGEGLDNEIGQTLERQISRESQEPYDRDSHSQCLLAIRPLPEDIKTKHPTLQISITGTIASAFDLRNRSQVFATLVSREDHTASHVEIGFRDVYLARSDMWKLVESELAGKAVYSGQRVLFLGAVRAVVKNIHVQGRRVSAAYFAPTTVPVFRSEAARYVLFVQMSREMWDFDSEGNGEILFNRVINGFLPDLFRRWSSLEVKHLVTIVMFGRLEYGLHDFATPGDPEKALRKANDGSIVPKAYEDFYRVVVTDMASAKWMTILDELKKDFRVFLRDISLEHQLNTSKQHLHTHGEQAHSNVKIRGRLSTAMKGNILEAINIASTQFANDYVDRDLIRTGISVVVITSGSGVFDVDRDLLNLTSENLTNNGIGIDIVCLSRMPLHSAPLFRYPVAEGDHGDAPDHLAPSSNTSTKPQSQTSNAIQGSFTNGSFPSSVISSISPGISRVASSVFTQDYLRWHYGIPHWVDLSYWTADSDPVTLKPVDTWKQHDNAIKKRKHAKRFIPRVRMYEPQMMGIMELGLANISIPCIRSRVSRTRRIRGPSSNKRDRPNRAVVSQSPDSSHQQASGGLLTAHARQQGDMIRCMDEYDVDVFSPPRRGKSRNGVKLPPHPPALSPPKIKKVAKPLKSESDEHRKLENTEKYIPEEKRAVKANKGLLSLLAAPQTSESPRISRSISYALRGIGAPPRATARTDINVENVQAQGLLAARSGSEIKGAGTAGTLRSLHNIDDSDANKSADMDSIIPFEDESAQSRENASMPISINATLRQGLHKGRRGSLNSDAAQLRRMESGTSTIKTILFPSISATSLETHVLEKDELSETDSDSDRDEGFKPGSVTQDSIPFIRNVNASNPVKYDPNVAAWFGRWQHIYPRKPKIATVKWRSLCTPASVPLTTEDFPGLHELETNFDWSTYVISRKDDSELREVPRTRKSLFSDMLALRLAHGYQWVVMSPTHKPLPMGSLDKSPMVLHQRLRQSDGNIYMTMGSTLQSLTLEGEHSVRVIRYRRKPKQDAKDVRKTIEYCANIRTILSPAYKAKTLQLTGYSEEYPWELADLYLADPKKILDNPVERLRFWRARFVLLPIDPPATAWKLAQSSSENEEEIHLLGIRALTQMWQRQRYIPPQEKTFSKPAILRNRNLNPLSIIFETLNPSEIVATELDKLLSVEDTGDLQPTQLLPESELFERETFTLPHIAQAMQGDKGIDIKNRRWHLRLHYNCFQGEDFTNWLLRTFKEGEFRGRDECVDFGNTLMEGGLFTHVNGRHNFKDGNYFYSIAPDYRAHRSESRQSWMGFPASRRSDKVVPVTPSSEKSSKDYKEPSPAGRRSRSSSIIEKTEKRDSPNDDMLSRQGTEKNRVSVSLSKMIPIDVDSRKRSTKTEVVHLYYDRLHNPENCYRFALTWSPTTTSALVENALSTWASQAEKYGLKLVEVPIAEASKVSDNEPFRAPYRVSLATQPPKKHPSGNGNFVSTSFSPLTPPAPDPHIYHKAILKRHNFVLDHEAATEFPSDVDVLLAWGKLEYTMTQYVHRSGVILAQITDDGSFLLLANRLYNTRSSLTKDSSNKFTFDATRRDRNVSRTRATTLGQPPLQASGILGLNAAPPSSPVPSPLAQPRASADVFGNRAALNASGFATYITPEQIKDELEAFAASTSKLEAFYREVTNTLAGPQARKSSSSVLRPDKGPDLGIIPEIILPPSLVTRMHKDVMGGGNGGKRVTSREQGQGSPLVKAETVDVISEAAKSPMRGATL